METLAPTMPVSRAIASLTRTTRRVMMAMLARVRANALMAPAKERLRHRVTMEIAARMMVVIPSRVVHMRAMMRPVPMTTPALWVMPALAESVEQELRCWLAMMGIFVPMTRAFQVRDAPPRPTRMYAMMAMPVQPPMGA